jgi:hypothetical protein
MSLDFFFTLRFKRSFIIHRSAASFQMEKGMLKSGMVWAYANRPSRYSSVAFRGLS